MGCFRTDPYLSVPIKCKRIHSAHSRCDLLTSSVTLEVNLKGIIGIYLLRIFQ